MTPEINGQNKAKTANASSPYYGVSIKENLWQMIVYQGSGKIFWATEKDEIYAARRRDLYILNHLPLSGYKMNFSWTEETKAEWMKQLGIE